MKAVIPTLFFLFLIISCTKTEDKTYDAQIIGFDASKCSCCWGWIIKCGNDTIKTENLPSNFKMEDNYPISVKIELGVKTNDCSASGLYNYFEIKRIERIE